MTLFLESEGYNPVCDELSDPPFAIGYVDGFPIFEGQYCITPGTPATCDKYADWDCPF
jgi:hypothetical protein